ncbi:hypothetical protein [Streptomyces sp. NBRC 110028]|uniref:hypothetical protein n=1 Tax=Streptomyces sp. NBRC 110028 TaxID=1621260 RepID=UPI0006E3BC2F|nr:hypothetical protein [Streptomyces sp. NBRC 110028]
MIPTAQQRNGRPTGLLARAVGCVGAAVLVCVLLAAILVVWLFAHLHHVTRNRERNAHAAVVTTAEKLRMRLLDANSDGALTRHEIDMVLNHRPAVRSLRREKTRTVLVVEIGASDWVQCYSYTALPTGAVSSAPLKVCPPSSTLIRPGP